MGIDRLLGLGLLGVMLGACGDDEPAPAPPCDPGFVDQAGACVDVDECASGTHDCDPNASCTNLPGGHECTCNPGFEGDGRSCSDIDDCADQPCQNGASCVDEIEGFHCDCADGFFGSDCSGVCDCQNGGDCDDGATGTGDCTCSSGYYGSNCSGVCDCQNGGDCDDGATGTGDCTCSSGYYGSDCAGVCDCQGGSVCDDGADGTGDCDCAPGTYGADCAGVCDCQNGASCDDGVAGTGDCTCLAGTYGADCAGVCDCQNGASCDDGIAGTGDCTCLAGTYGSDCAGVCDCQNGASCDDGVAGTGDCTCLAGTYGADCSGVCDCQNGGTCADGAAGTGDCTCLAGTYGADCSGVCDCQNGGTCDDGAAGSGTCTCAFGWTGVDCSTDIDECSGSDHHCASGCVNLPGSYECVCQAGYSPCASGCCAWRRIAVPDASLFEDCAAATDSLGLPHLVQNDRTYLALDHSGWTSEAVALPGATDERLSIALDSNDLPHVGVAVSNWYVIGYTYRTASSWSATHTVNPQAGCASGYPYGIATSIDLDAGDVAQFAHVSFCPDWGLTIYGYENLGGPDEEFLSLLYGNNQQSVGFAIADDGSLHAVHSWDHTSPGSISYRWHDGNSWNSEGAASGRYVSLATDSANRPHIVYEASGAIMHAVREGSWLEDLVAPASTAPVGVVVEASDQPAVAFKESGSTLRYAVWDGAIWQTVTVSTSAGESCFTEGPHLLFREGPDRFIHAFLDDPVRDTCVLDATTDPDDDGWCSSADNCPTIANADQLDVDDDGYGDLCPP